MSFYYGSDSKFLYGDGTIEAFGGSGTGYELHTREVDTGGTSSGDINSPDGGSSEVIDEYHVSDSSTSGWVRRWIRMSEADELAQRQAIESRYDELLDEAIEQGLSGHSRRDFLFEQMRQFREKWLKDFLKNRKNYNNGWPTDPSLRIYDNSICLRQHGNDNSFEIGCCTRRVHAITNWRNTIV